MSQSKLLGILQPVSADHVCMGMFVVSLLSILQPMTADQVCTHKSMCPGERVCVLVRDKSNGWGILQPGTADQSSIGRKGHGISSLHQKMLKGGLSLIWRARSRKEKNAIAAAAAAVTRATSLNAAQAPSLSLPALWINRTEQRKENGKNLGSENTSCINKGKGDTLAQRDVSLPHQRVRGR
eukprot:1150889-Pelagomonas_calceolata.AAC.3